jgi:NADPH2:quinone reductase
VRAVIVDRTGGIESTRLGDIPVPEPGPGEVLLDVKATAVNYVDLLIIAGGYQFRHVCPFVPGKCPAGLVHAVGSGVTGLRPGDRVLVTAEQGGYAEFAVAPQDQCYPLPASMSFPSAAAMALVYDTAWVALHDRARMQNGDVVLVLGASGGVGLAATRLAKACGARVLAGIADRGKSELVLDAGADAVIAIGGNDLHDALRRQVYDINGGDGVDIILDPLGGEVFDAAIRALAWRGRLVVIGFAAGRIPILKVNYLLLKNIEISGLQLSDYRKRLPETMRSCFTDIFELYEAGKVGPGPISKFPLEDYQAALRQVRDRAVSGRVILAQDD